jgi:hypothetical protein
MSKSKESNDYTQTVIEVGRTLDALAALSTDLACHCDVPPDRLILSARKVREICGEIDAAVLGLRRLLEIAHQTGNGPIPQSQLRDIGGGPQT